VASPSEHAYGQHPARCAMGATAKSGAARWCADLSRCGSARQLASVRLLLFPPAAPAALRAHPAPPPPACRPRRSWRGVCGHALPARATQKNQASGETSMPQPTVPQSLACTASPGPRDARQNERPTRAGVANPGRCRPVSLPQDRPDSPPFPETERYPEAPCGTTRRA
jgi:hypothetical protein